MATVKQLLQEKGDEVWSVDQNATVLDALYVMDAKDIGAVVVLDGDQMVGIFSERDLARQASQNAALALHDPVSRYMTQLVYYVWPDQTIEECMALMTHRRIRHLPVMDGEHLVGIISIGDVVKQIISSQESTIRGLENYITGQEYHL